MNSLEVLVICSGNICRSPVAEHLLTRHLGPLGVVVVSAGTSAPLDAPISAQMAQLLHDRGIDASTHRSQFLTPTHLQHADLVIGMTTQHRSRAADLAPATLRSCFTLRGLAHVAEHAPREEVDRLADAGGPSARLRALITLASRYRMLGGADDIADPMGQDDQTYVRVFNEIETAVAQIVAAAVPHE